MNLDSSWSHLFSKGYNVNVELLSFDLECLFIYVVWYHNVIHCQIKRDYNIKAFKYFKYSALFSNSFYCRDSSKRRVEPFLCFVVFYLSCYKCIAHFVSWRKISRKPLGLPSIDSLRFHVKERFCNDKAVSVPSI